VDLRDLNGLWVFDGGTTRRRREGGDVVVRRGEAAGVWPNSVQEHRNAALLTLCKVSYLPDTTVRCRTMLPTAVCWK
jgi:hypothetical protein